MPALAQAQSEVHGTRLGPFHSSDAHFVAEVVAVGFQAFSGLAVLPDGRILTGERPNGRLSVVNPETGARSVVHGVPRVHDPGGAGLIDLRPDPDFATNHLLYYSYSLPGEHGSTLAVERARLEGDSLLEARRVFTAMPWSDSSDHYGGRLVRSGEYLFISLGIVKSATGPRTWARITGRSSASSPMAECRRTIRSSAGQMRGRRSGATGIGTLRDLPSGRERQSCGSTSMGRWAEMRST